MVSSTHTIETTDYTTKRTEYNQARGALHVHPHMHQIQDPPSTTMHRATNTSPYI